MRAYDKEIDTYVVLASWRDSVHELLLAHVILAGLFVFDCMLHEFLSGLERHLRFVFGPHETLLHSVFGLLHLARDVLHHGERVALQLFALQRVVVLRRMYKGAHKSGGRTSGARSAKVSVVGVWRKLAGVHRQRSRI